MLPTENEGYESAQISHIPVTAFSQTDLFAPAAGIIVVRA